MITTKRHTACAYCKFGWLFVLGLGIFLAHGAAVQAQPNAPHVGYIYPAGGRQGSTFQALIGGQFLGETSNVYISGNGVETKIIENIKPLTQKQVTELREKIQELQKKPKDKEIIKEIADIRKKLDNFQKKRANPVLAENVIVQVTISPDAEPGQHELRLATPNGLSSPMVFQVGHLTEFTKNESNNSEDPKPGPGPQGNRDARPAKPTPEIDVTIPAVVNGQIMPGGVDRYRFQARKGQRLVVAVSARSLIPYLADAVPGWFQAALTLYDSNGNELAHDDHYRFRPDPVIYCKIPKDGRYTLEIHDSIYRGREDFVYRIALGELPFIISAFPLGGPTGEPTTVELKGWNLAVTKLVMDAKDKEPGTLPLLVRKGNMISNQVPFAVDSLPECLEQEPNDKPTEAQKIALPIIVNGRIDKPGDIDVFRIDGLEGEEIVAEVDARKLDSPLDSFLKLTDVDGRQLAANDDYGDKGAGLSTHQADSLLKFTLPAKGVYYLCLSDAQHKGGAEYAYRLRISELRPDFELRVAPSSINVRAGASIPITVYALRKDGFSEQIKLTLKDAPEGFLLNGALAPANQDLVRLTLTAPQTPLEEPVKLQLEGRATIQGREVVRTAVPAEDMMQAFIYRHLVPSQEFMVAVTGRGRPRPPLKLVGDETIKLPTDGTATVRFSLPRRPQMDQIQLTLVDPPDGISIKNVSQSQEGVVLILQTDSEKVKPGLKGNLIVDAFTERTVNPGDAKQPANKRRVPLGTLPAIPFEIVEQH
jgi:hypothetical protein